MMTSVLPPLKSLGHELNPDHIGFLEDSRADLKDPEALRSKLEEDGYLYIRNFFEPELILNARRSIFERLAESGEIDGTRDFMEGHVPLENVESFALDAAPTFKEADGKKRNPDKAGAFRPELAAQSPAVKRVVFGPEICDFYAGLFAEPIRHFDFIWARFMGPGHGTPSHCDWVYMSRGSRQLLTCWIPYVEIPLEVGGLMILEKSHQQSDRFAAYLEQDVDSYCENRPSQVEKVAKGGGWSHRGWLSSRPDTLPEKFGTRWLTSEHFGTGDFLTFRMDVIHGSLDNQSDRIRFSTDTRYQPASHPADERWVGVNPPGHSIAGKRGRIC